MAAVSRELIYWPRGKEYSVAWILSINVYFVIAGWRGPHQPLLVTDSLPASAVGRSAFVLLLLVLGALLFWGHVRLQFLTWKTACRPVFTTFIALFGAYLLLWSAMAVLRGRVVPTAVPEWLVTTEEAANALAGFVAVLLVTSIWKTEDPGVSNVRLERQTVLEKLPLLDNDMSEGDFDSLASAVEALPVSLGSLRPRLQFNSDIKLAAQWQGAAEELAKIIPGKSLGQILAIPGAGWKNALEKLAKEQV